eukprot:scaffold29169_cov14-Prasinocladus_malaysianus.AAC.2
MTVAMKTVGDGRPEFIARKSWRTMLVEVIGPCWEGVVEVVGGGVASAGSSVMLGRGCIGIGVWDVVAAPDGGKMAGVSGSAAVDSSFESDEVASRCWG